MSRTKKILLIVAGVFGLGIFAIGGWWIGTSNDLVELDEQVNGSWGQVENVLQRRHDLIPNLVSSVEGSMKQEQDIFTAIADSRRTIDNASSVEDTADAEAELSNNLQTLVNVIHEAYPDLASNQNVQDLMTQLEGTENRIATERMRYNETVTTYNTTIRKIPTNIVASLGGYESRDLFEMQEGAESAPTVDFNLD